MSWASCSFVKPSKPHTSSSFIGPVAKTTSRQSQHAYQLTHMVLLRAPKSLITL
ncbi:hypothetical protein FOPG_16326 [Fusarium oxysporum f. sp. conglutinans race 2 54008]|uniref:Uncharacterized protein n=1 Tax=Fusarium oxysporum f. sp. conglutinans race 2 54008 TaxID=1089457 RepID=X0H6H1_FUSOX|nr:hypothetical protein FOPG_16326 [Fusarium oxysporum f. sp. conglutinans race 2 54008]